MMFIGESILMNLIIINIIQAHFYSMSTVLSALYMLIIESLQAACKRVIIVSS